MKKLALLLSLLLFSGGIAFADETTAANQQMEIEANKALITIQKQPTDEKSKQTQTVKNNWFCIVVQVNGKVLEEKATQN